MGAKNGASGGTFTFQRVRTNAIADNYADVMVEECAKMGMKPLCDSRKYCQNDPKSIYIGQTHHIAHTPHRNVDAYFPSGWSQIKAKFPSTFCTYTAHYGGNAKSLCTTGGSHSWQTISGNREIMCVKLG
jgi:hypothetical protein